MEICRCPFSCFFTYLKSTDRLPCLKSTFGDSIHETWSSPWPWCAFQEASNLCILIKRSKLVVTSSWIYTASRFTSNITTGVCNKTIPRHQTTGRRNCISVTCLSTQFKWQVVMRMIRSHPWWTQIYNTSAKSIYKIIALLDLLLDLSTNTKVIRYESSLNNLQTQDIPHGTWDLNDQKIQLLESFHDSIWTWA